MTYCKTTAFKVLFIHLIIIIIFFFGIVHSRDRVGDGRGGVRGERVRRRGGGGGDVVDLMVLQPAGKRVLLRGR